MKILVVEDSVVVLTYIVTVLQEDETFHQIIPANNGIKAVEAATKEKPDVILMDLHLPKMDGMEAIRQIMSQSPCPIVVLSGYLKTGEDITFEALRAGAVEVIAKPEGLGSSAQDTFMQQLKRTLRVMSQVKVVRRVRRDEKPKETVEVKETSQPRSSENNTRILELTDWSSRIKVVSIGSSTGGPALLYKILSNLKPLACPVLISQHIMSGFETRLCDWLSTTGHKVQLVTETTDFNENKIYVSSADGSMVLLDSETLGVVNEKNASVTPCIDRLLSSVATYYGAQSCNIILTGMGRDGTAGLEKCFQAGAMNIAQTPESCVVASMPKNAIEAKATKATMTPEEIIQFLQALQK